jgi:hypothetical protein
MKYLPGACGPFGGTETSTRACSYGVARLLRSAMRTETPRIVGSIVLGAQATSGSRDGGKPDVCLCGGALVPNVPPAGFEPATKRLEGSCSIP